MDIFVMISIILCLLDQETRDKEVIQAHLIQLLVHGEDVEV